MRKLTEMGGAPAAPTPAVPWNGRVDMGIGWAVFGGCAGDNQPHRHPALQLCVGQGGPVRVELDDITMEAPGVLIGTDVRHALHSGSVWLIYIECQSALGRRLESAAGDRVRCLDSLECDELRAIWDAAGSAQQGILALVDRLAGTSPLSLGAQGTQARLHALIAALPEIPPDEWRTDALASRVHLSASRFAHAFREVAGMAVRPYLRWLRLVKALDDAGRGRTLTEAAHAAGFADAAHLTRTMQRHFGISPRAVVQALRADRHLLP